MEKNRVAHWRKQAGMSQTSLADCVGISRQSLHMIEAGEQAPRVYLALAIARELGCKVDDIFPLAMPVDLRCDTEVGEGNVFRACVAEINGVQVVRRAVSAGVGSSIAPSDVVARSGRLGLSFETDLGRSGLFVDGCDPVLGLLANRVNESNKDFKVRWFYGSNSESISRLHDGWSHCALVHFDSIQNIEHGAERDQVIEIPFGRWEIALCFARGNPKNITSIEDLCRSDMRIAVRNIGSGIRSFIDGQLEILGLRMDELEGIKSIYANHYQVAASISLGVCDVGLVPLSIAREHDLEYISVGIHTSVLHLSAEGLRVGAEGGLFDILSSRTFVSEVSALGGYQLAS